MRKILKFIFGSILVLGYLPINAQNYCITSCNGNSYVTSSDPNTLEYDNMVGLFHATIAKEKNGTFKVWGQNSGSNGTSNLLVPTAIDGTGSGNAKFTYTGTPLKATGGNNSDTISHQFALLTSTGLYVWGTANTLITDSITSNTTINAVSIGTYGVANAGNPSYSKGLPYGVNPTDVKMLFGSYGTLVIVTCTGDAWVLSFTGYKYGDGSTQTTANSAVWHRVKTNDTGNPDLTNVVAIRGTSNALFALLSDGNLYTWGMNTYDNSGASSNKTFATFVSKPTGVTPKMIGMTQDAYARQSYYLLSSDGKLYTMGYNGSRLLGDLTTTERLSWVQPQKPSSAGQGTGNLDNIAWISPNEHSTYLGNTAAINVITNDFKQWGWGDNSGNMLGQSGGGPYDPIYMPGNSTNANGLGLSDDVIAVETGGHTTINVKKCTNYFGYVGHKSSGSMGDNSSAGAHPYLFSYSTAILLVCGTDTGPRVKDIKICPNTTVNLNTVNLETDPTQVEWHATNDASSPVITNITAMGPGTYYAFYTVASGKCRIVGSVVNVSNFVPTDAGYSTCLCYKPAILDAGNTYPTQQGITALGRAGANNSNWPMVRQSAWTALESKEKGFVVNRVTKTVDLANITNPVEGMMVYDIEAKCLKVYTIKEGDTNPAWWCMTTSACPD